MIDKETVVPSIDVDNLEQPKVYKNAQFSIAYATKYGEIKFWINDNFMVANYRGKDYVISLPVAMFKQAKLVIGEVNPELVGFITPAGLGAKRLEFDSNRAINQLTDALNNTDNVELQTSGVVQRVSQFINSGDFTVDDKADFDDITKAAGDLALNTDEAKEELANIIGAKGFGKVISRPISDLVMLLPRLQQDLDKSGLFDVFLDGDKVFKEAK